MALRLVRRNANNEGVGISLLKRVIFREKPSVRLLTSNNLNDWLLELLNNQWRGLRRVWVVKRQN